MCGIVFKHNFDKTPVNNEILQQYDSQAHRGRQGYGVFDLEHKKLFRSKTEDEIIEYLIEHESSSMMFHHRMPTSTINVPKAAHPLRTGSYFGDTEYVLVHNGIIRNADELFVKHQELGIDYSTFLTDLTFNDSESLLWDFALTMQGKQDKMTTRGDMAFVCIKLFKGKVKKMYFGRNGRPLNIWLDEQTVELSSEGRGSMVPTDLLNTYDFKTKTLTAAKMVFDLGVKFRKPDYRTSPGYRPTEYYPERNTRNEYKSYDEYHLHKFSETKKEAVERKWNSLRAKAQSQLKRLGSGRSVSVEDILDAREEDGKFIVDNNPVDIDKIVEDKKLYEPTTGEIQNFAMDYLMDCEGNFDQAYSIMEFEYAEKMSEVAGKETLDDIRLQFLFECAMEFIMKDPEYTDENSVSSIYEALWSQQSLSLTA